jgi:adenylyl-sulfate kinase
MSSTTDNLTWTRSQVTREQRWSRSGHRGAVVWLTGLSGSGKSTVAVGLDAWLHEQGLRSFVLDGDNLRHGLCQDLSFSNADRIENIRRAGEAAKILAEAGLVCISAFISPFTADRQRVRESCCDSAIPFVEVFINAPLAVCEGRDPRGLYKRARAGQIPGFTGIDSPYEPPPSPDIELHTDQHSPQECVVQVGELVRTLCSITS